MTTDAMHRGTASTPRTAGRVGSWLVSAAWLAVACAATASAATAQIVRGRVLEEGAGTPLPGAMIVLVDAEGTQVGRILTDDLGRFTLRAPRTGTYTLRADRIGYASITSPPLELAAGAAAFHDMVVPVQAIALDNITVEGERRCVLRPEGGLDVARVWEEARKALAAAAFTDETSVYRYVTMRYERDLDPDARTVMNEQRNFSDLMQRQTFVSRPVEELMADGFVQEEEDGTYYYAPDANVMLSDAFLDTHCLRVREGEDETEGLIGLAFEPVEGRRGHIDIDGVMWLEPESSELQWLEYNYADLDADLRSRHLGGKVMFAGLPNGTWVVREWYIRMPRPGMRPNPFTNIPERFLAGIRETGAVVMRILTPLGETLVEAETGTIEGTVLDSLHTRPLEGARVFAEGTDHSALTGEDGLYRLTGLTEGVYRIGYHHPLLEEVGFAPEPVEVEVRRGQIAPLRLLTPSRGEVLRDACAEVEAVDRTSVLAGRVVDGVSGVPVDGALVTATWTGWDIGTIARGSNPRGGGDPNAGLVRLEQRDGQYEAITGGDGRFLFCRVPVGPSVVVEAAVADRAAEPETLVLEEAGRPEFMTVYIRN
ncbi:MAG: carboxypeptidase regulatory-like domain-containing protein [Gammaproteobacteria bacterium]|nr:carboxypeptidase regulatory-like domain-containing protein [Gammaproteobacteria bacterium]